MFNLYPMYSRGSNLIEIDIYDIFAQITNRVFTSVWLPQKWIQILLSFFNFYFSYIDFFCESYIPNQSLTEMVIDLSFMYIFVFASNGLDKGPLWEFIYKSNYWPRVTGTFFRLCIWCSTGHIKFFWKKKITWLMSKVWMWI